jgi:epoxyqueuosine reductase
MLTAEFVKQQAKAMGADLVGIASIDRFEGAPIQQDPRQIMPEAKSVIAVAFRVNRGSLRGVEEGTFFSNYSAMGYGGITYLFMPLMVMNLARIIEDEGYEAIPYGHQSDWRAIDNEGNDRTDFSRPVAPGRAAPDVAVHLRIAAYLAGLGEIGYSKVFLTPQYGPRQRVGIIITEAELEPDPIYNGPALCNRCKACVRECPGQAISGTETVKVTLAGHEVEWGALDCKACDIAFRGAKPVTDSDDRAGYMDSSHGQDFAPSEFSPFYKKPRNLYNTGQAVCGGRGCLRACMINLEARGVLENKFYEKFRRRKPWLVDWATEPGAETSAECISETD